MKIAIFHDDFCVWGGAERFVVLVADNLKADIITFSLSSKIKKLVNQYAPKGVTIKTLSSRPVRDVFDSIKRYHFSKVDFSKDYDFFIFSGYKCIIAARKHKPNLCYTHTIPISLFKNPNDKLNINMPKTYEAPLPLSQTILLMLCKTKELIIKRPFPKPLRNIINFFFFMSLNYFNPAKAPYFKFMITPESHLQDINEIQILIANSIHTQNKIKKFYNRKSKLIYPIVETKKFKYRKPQNYWLSVNRLIGDKRIDLQLKAFTKIPRENLYIIGQPHPSLYYEKLKDICPKNVYFLGLLDENKLIEKLSKCKGFIFTAPDEDFGVAPVEAMASGKPVIAPNEGGLKETIIHKKTGILINDISEEKIIKAIKEIGKNPEKYKKDCIKQAKKFDTKIFVKKIKKGIER